MLYEFSALVLFWMVVAIVGIPSVLGKWRGWFLYAAMGVGLALMTGAIFAAAQKSDLGWPLAGGMLALMLVLSPIMGRLLANEVIGRRNVPKREDYNQFITNQMEQLIEDFNKAMDAKDIKTAKGLACGQILKFVESEPVENWGSLKVTRFVGARTSGQNISVLVETLEGGEKLETVYKLRKDGGELKISDCVSRAQDGP